MPDNLSTQGENSIIATAAGTTAAVKIAEPSVYQLELLPHKTATVRSSVSYCARLTELLASDLDFHGYDTGYASHDFHAFPAKFPPQLPRKFIRTLTTPGAVVLDPMMGSGTTVVEGYLAGCTAIGVDIDPLAQLITRVKTTPIAAETLTRVAHQIVKNATEKTERGCDELVSRLETRWDAKTTGFIEYWFAKETQVELLALVEEIETIEDDRIRDFFWLSLSACIITKSGGVSLAFDLAHTRPHRAKIAFAPSGALVTGEEFLSDTSPRVKLLTKNVRSALVEFRKRTQQNINSLNELPQTIPAQVHLADAQRLPIGDNSVDLIVTSPPYAVNAIDYMRANKFSLTWLGYSLEQLAETRKDCIGGESVNAALLEELPAHTRGVVADVMRLDPKRGHSLRRYYSEMTRILREMQRVLKPERAAVVVVASSVIRDRDTETDKCLVEIGRSLGFDAPHIGIRRLDRNRRMMPAGHKIHGNSPIQKRMHQEFVIGFYKPKRRIRLRPIS